MADLQWIDQLQKLHSNAVSFWPRVQLEGYIEGGHVLVAESDSWTADGLLIAESGRVGVAEGGQPAHPLRSEATEPLGYVISKDRYFKRDDCGIIFQLNVMPGEHRKLVGASLVKTVFERSAYGCKLFSCWCAQDIEANHFWGSIGFVPLAFRTGSREGRSRRGQPRIHIFWQRRIREGDNETPYWFPCSTNAGAIREDRLVFPIPPGTHWSDAKPIVLPGAPSPLAPLPAGEGDLLQPHPREKKRKREMAQPAEKIRPKPRKGLWFAAAQEGAAKDPHPHPNPPPQSRGGKQRLKNDPKHVAMARELRDRYLEEVNSGRMLPAAEANGKYEVSRALPNGHTTHPLAPSLGGRGNIEVLPLLEAA